MLTWTKVQKPPQVIWKQRRDFYTKKRGKESQISAKLTVTNCARNVTLRWINYDNKQGEYVSVHYAKAGGSGDVALTTSSAKTEIAQYANMLFVCFLFSFSSQEWYRFEACSKVIPKSHEMNLKSIAFLNFWSIEISPKPTFAWKRCWILKVL